MALGDVVVPLFVVVRSKMKSGQPGAPEAVPMKTLPVRRATTGFEAKALMFLEYCVLVKIS